ncbi:MAG: calcium/sodium antiporter [Candidatus Omnitrophica bacterium]|nr:calcium/sodium antiporter [Candidatus Omnitrophota bacterium]
MINILLLSCGFILLLKGADLLVEGATHIARKFNVSDMVIGLTVVAFGTSLPELFVNIHASMRGSAEIAIANVLGSNSANILLILGVSAIIYPLIVNKGTVWKEIPVSFLAVAILGILVADSFIDENGFCVISRGDGVVLLGFFIVFLLYLSTIMHNPDDSFVDKQDMKFSLFKMIMFIFFGLCGLMFGGKFIVDAAITLARHGGISERVIGLTIVAVGTSLPELATSAVAAYKHNAEIAVGNIVGSNIFNIFFILGISACVRPLPYAFSSNIDMLIVAIASLLLFVSMFTGKRRAIDRWEGIVFIIMYIAYIVFIVKG